MRRLALVPYILGAIMLAMLGLGLSRRAVAPPHVIETGSVAITDTSGTRLIFGKRVVETGGVTSTEIQIPGKGWVDCRGDCKDVLRPLPSGPGDGLRLK